VGKSVVRQGGTQKYHARFDSLFVAWSTGSRERRTRKRGQLPEALRRGCYYLVAATVSPSGLVFIFVFFSCYCPPGERGITVTGWVGSCSAISAFGSELSMTVFLFACFLYQLLIASIPQYRDDYSPVQRDILTAFIWLVNFRVVICDTISPSCL